MHTSTLLPDSVTQDRILSRLVSDAMDRVYEAARRGNPLAVQAAKDALAELVASLPEMARTA